jgi:hypothetical protein
MNNGKSRLLFFIGLVAYCSSLAAQKIEENIRSLDNNHALATDSTDWLFHRRIKEIPLSRHSTKTLLSLGGEIRQQVRYYNNINFGNVRPGTAVRDLYWLQRYLLHADLQINMSFRVFAQLNSCHAVGKDHLVEGIDRDDLGLMQAFVDIRFGTITAMQLRLGRQDISFGAERFMGTRDGPNVRQTFDGIMYTIKKDRIRNDIFIAAPVSYHDYYLDNTTLTSELVCAEYLTLSLDRYNRIEFYGFSNRRKKTSYEQDTARESRYSFGLMCSNDDRALHYEAELTGQAGSFGNKKISAWQFHTVIGYTWQEHYLKPGLQLRQQVASGNRQTGDQYINTFRPVSAKPPINDVVPTGQGNMILLAPEGEIGISDELLFIFRYYAVWRYSSHDGIYTTDMNTLLYEPDPDRADDSRFFCQGMAAVLDFAPNQHFHASLTASIYIPEEFALNAGAVKNIEALVFRMSYWF